MTRLFQLRPGRSGPLAALALVSLFAASAARAQITPIASPFSGSLSESFESFPNYSSAGYLATPASVFGGSATFTGTSRGAIYQPGLSIFGVGSSGLAQVADGVKGLGLGGSGQTGIFTFASPISDFGGFWGAGTDNDFGLSDPATVSVSFFDSLNAQIGVTQTFNYSRSGPRDGLLIWQGWSSSTPITSVRFTAPFLAGDAFQANAAIVPEPSEWATLGFAALGIGALTLRARRARRA